MRVHNPERRPTKYDRKRSNCKCDVQPFNPKAKNYDTQCRTSDEWNHRKLYRQWKDNPSSETFRAFYESPFC